MTTPEDTIAKRITRQLTTKATDRFAVIVDGVSYASLDAIPDDTGDDVRAFAVDFFDSVSRRDDNEHTMIPVTTPIPDNVDVTGDPRYLIVLIRLVDMWKRDALTGDMLS